MLDAYLSTAPVAPHAGAWIETAILIADRILIMSLLTQERGLKRCVLLGKMAESLVAPHAGAWIETKLVVIGGSHNIVAPHAGAWIETFSAALTAEFARSRSSRRSVD